ncbi:MAG: HEAT repeat domain-containing protein [Syntrophobacterales bacterium]|nr:MAG: HEAT repeat domain-containing protein [Syntrophobacterales bacterium]
MKRLTFTGKVLALGLFTAQIIATIQVYLSNLELHRATKAIGDAGYLIVPNENILPLLLEWKPAFFGGIFFTLSTGAGLTLLAIAAAWAWDRFFSRRRLALIPFICIWITALGAANYRGFLPLVTAYTVIIPVLCFVATLRWMPERGQKTWFREILPVIPLILLSAIWASQMGSDLFLDIRDNILLSNPAGKKINEFYYDYTLYPAEVFKTERLKLLKTCRLEGIDQKGNARFLERKLIYNDYLPMREGDDVDLIIRKEGKNLFLEREGKVIMETTPADFSSRMPTLLKEFSSRSDKHHYFRKFTFFSILVGFPITLYILIYSLFRAVFSLFLSTGRASVGASLICFAAGIALLLPFQIGRGTTIDVENLAGAMGSDKWQVRVSALKVIREKEIEIGDFPAYKGAIESPSIPERYWLATVLKESRDPETYRDLLIMLDDPHPNVRCKVLEALGKRGRKDVVGTIIESIKTSDHWYFQWYAYRALRSLGWKQQKSI